MNLVISSVMRQIEEKAINDYGIPPIVLMENAGREVVDAIDKEMGPSPGRAVILCGPGNNGGDGFVVARHLKTRGWMVRIFLACPPEKYSGPASTNLRIASAYGISIDICQEDDTSRLSAALIQADLAVDALLGIGSDGPPRGMVKTMIEALSSFGGTTVSVDLPSGVNPDDGSVPSSAVKAFFTVSFGLPKPCFFLFPGASMTGRLYVGDICLPPELLRKDSNFTLLTGEKVRALLPRRNRNSHKGSHGKILVIAGSQGMSGAAILVALAAYKAGAGLITVACPSPVCAAVASSLPEALILELPHVNGAISPQALPLLEEPLKKADAVIIGPGLSNNPLTLQCAHSIIKNCEKPMVIDGCALATLNINEKICRENTIITPHPLEGARILNSTVEEIESQRVESAARLSTGLNCACILKGAYSIIADPSGNIAINPAGNSGLAKGGSGDVLAGICGAFLAQGLNSFDGAAVASFIHGTAGDIIADEIGTYGILGTELADGVALAIWKVLNGKKAN